MSDLVFVLVGQCGTTLGTAFFEAVRERCGLDAFLDRGRLRAVLVDTEPKSARAATARLPFGASVVSRTGRGGNFALGYYGPRRRDDAGPAVWTTALDDADAPEAERELVDRASDAVRAEASAFFNFL